MDYSEFYQSNADFHGYVDRYCAEYSITVEEALKHKLVQYTAEYYKDQEADRSKKQGKMEGEN